MRWIAALCALSLALAVQVALGDPPRQISYQGILKEAGGGIVDDGVYEFTFRLYNSDFGGAPLWSEDQFLAVESGVFNAVLGSITPLNLDFGTSYWLGIAIGHGSDLTPRIKLNAAPYALNADRLDGHDASEFATAVHSHRLDDLADVATSGASNGQVLTYQQGAWGPEDPGGLAQIQSVIAGAGLTGGGDSGDVTLDVASGPGLSIVLDAVQLDAAHFDGSAYDARFVNEAQSDAITSGMIAPNLVSSLDGVSNDAGDINLVAGANVTITPDDAANTITIAAAAGGSGDITSVVAGVGLSGGATSGDATLDIGVGDGLASGPDAISVDAPGLAGAGLTDDGANNLQVATGTGLEVAADAVRLTSPYQDGSAFDARFVNEAQSNAITSGMIAPNLVSSLDGVSNDAGDIDLVAGANVTITPNDAANTITISAVGGGGGGDITSVVAGVGLSGGATSGDATLDIGVGDGLASGPDAISVDATDLVGPGLTDDGANNLQVATGTGLEVAAGAVRLTSPYQDGSVHDARFVNEAQSNSVTTAMVTPDLVSSLDGVGNDGGNIDLVAGSNISISSNDALNTVTIASLVDGDVTGVTAGTGLTGGGSSGDLTLNVGTGDGISASANAISVNATDIEGAGLTVNSNNLDVNTGAGLEIVADAVRLTTPYQDGSAHDARFVNEAQANSVTAAMVTPDVVGSLDGVSNDAGNIDLIAGANISITPSDANNTITIASTGGGNGDITSVVAGVGLVGGATSGDATLDIGVGTGLEVIADAVRLTTPYQDGSAHDARFVNEAQANAVTTAMITPDLVSNVDGVSNDGGGIDLVAGANVTILPDDVGNSITISAAGGGDVTGVAAGAGLSGGGGAGDLNLDVSAGPGLTITGDAVQLGPTYLDGSAHDPRFVNEAQADAVTSAMIAPNLVSSLDGVNNDAGNIDLIAGANISISSSDVNNTITIASQVNGDITSVVAGSGLAGGGSSGDVTVDLSTGPGLAVSADAVQLDASYLDGSAHDARFVNEAQANAVTSAMIAPNVLSDLDGVSNDGGGIDLVAGANVTITPDDAANTITITAAGGGGDDGDWVIDGINLYSGVPGNVGIGTSAPAEKLDVTGKVRADRFVSTVTTGTAPLQVNSTTIVSNLNVDLLDGQDAAAFAAAGHSHDLGALNDVNVAGAADGEVLTYSAGDWVSAPAGSGDVTAVTAGTGLTGGGVAGDLNLDVSAGPGLTITADAVQLGAVYLDGSAHDARFVNEAQANAITSGMIAPNLVSSVDGVSNDAGNIDLVAGANVTITPDDGTNTITIAASGGGSGDITSVVAGVGLVGGAASGDATLDVGVGAGLEVAADEVRLTVPYQDGSAHDARFVNEGQADAVTGAMIAPNVVSSLDGVSNDAGNIDLVAGANITISPNDAGNTITISAAGGGGDDGDWTIDGDNIYSSLPGNVGIGTSTPGQKLDVAGAIRGEQVIADSHQDRAGEFLSDYPFPVVHVLHAEYTNTGTIDAYGVWAQSRPQDRYGIGGHFEGGYHGLEGHVIPTGNGEYTGLEGFVFGGTGTNTGLSGYAQGSGVNYGVSGYAGGGALNYAGYFQGDVHVTGNLSKAGGAFKIDHPLDPSNKYLSHSFVESPDMMNVYNGNVLLDERGEAWIELPDWFETLNRDFRYQLTCLGAFAPIYVAEKIAGNRFKIAGGAPGLEVSWQVTGIRQDKWAEAHRIPVEELKPEAERGLYLHPELYGQPDERSVDYQVRQKVRSNDRD